MNKPFLDLFKREKTLSSSKNLPKMEASEKSTPLIILGILVSVSSIFLLLYTIKSRFG